MKSKTTSSKTTSSKSATRTPSRTTLKFLHLYPNMMDLYGDSGNLQILKYRAEKRGIKVQIDSHIIASNESAETSAPDFSAYDLIFLGGGSDKEQKVVARDILNYRADLKNAYDSGVFLLTICGGFQLCGKYYKDAEDNLIDGLALFDFYTESSTDKSQRCIGNIVIETEIDQKPVKLVGFENHGGQTHGVAHPFGRVLAGNGNTFRDSFEGMRTPNFIGTYLHGPLLSKNPELSDSILAYCLARKAKNSASPKTTASSKTSAETPKSRAVAESSLAALPKLDDNFELTARREMLEKLLR